MWKVKVIRILVNCECMSTERQEIRWSNCMSSIGEMTREVVVVVVVVVVV